MKKVFVLLSLLVVTGAVQAETLDINLSDKALRGAFAAPLSNVFPRVGGIYELGAIAAEKDGRNLFQGHAGLLVTGDAGAATANINAGLGGRILLLDAEEFSGGALALGGMIEARLPAYNRIGAFIYVYGAPSASAFGDLDGYLEYALSVDYQVIKSASIYAGYRQIKIKGDTGSEATVDNGFHLGLRLNF